MKKLFASLVLALIATVLPACGSNDSATDDAGTAGTTGAAGTTGVAGTTGSAGTTGRGGTTGSAGSGGGRGGTTGTGGSGGSGGSTTGLPQLTVNGSKLQDPNGKTIVLRGSSLIDIGALYAYNGNSAAGITNRMDKIAAAGVQGHVVRLPVYPKISYNGGSPYCAPVPYPVGTGPTASCAPTTPLNAADYVSRVLRPAVDYARGKNPPTTSAASCVPRSTTRAARTCT